ncbi:DUF58 domain-containing protein [Anaeromyxobacter oryzae]|uniref:DUF58 domain-containing protein n=1 Tax=Anaeromyxobacter oryzae TaxID=2918170 RepID=A0ABM7WYM1_9BACT|nr:DUF58 domain-containing protein [Anaeromyxobacter oryzae]BDG04583.1 hypothetical protein AMOR_35790 [Anaeromyxobacter oryzae]
MIYPTPRAVALVAAGFPVALLPALVHPRLWGLWLVAAALSAIAIGLDALLAPAPRGVSMEIDVPGQLPIGEAGAARVSIAGVRGARALEVLADLHADLAPQPVRGIQPGPDGRAELEIPLLARRRGRPTVDALWLRWQGPLGLAGRRRRVEVARAISVVPNLRPVRAAAFRYFGARELSAGVQVERFLGDGSEFEALVEYVPGLDPRAISWKASARHRELLCQEFRAERNHQVVLALDTGHLVAEPLEGVPRLDHAVSSALLLAYVSLRLGDRVGLYAFDRAARAWAEPQGGLGSFARLQTLSAQLAYSTEETNFTLGLAELSTRLRRRSLVVVFTEFVDTVTAELMIENLSRLARRQLVVFVSLRDPGLDAAALAAPHRVGDVYRSVVAADFVRERERVLARLRRMGIQCVDAAPGQVSAQLVNRYLDIKRREQIA